MQTRCPACQTLYRIDEDVLKRAGGQARCFRCDTVFDAYSNPASGPEQEPAHANTPLADDAATPGHADSPDGTDTDSEALSELSALADLPEVPEANGFSPQDALDLSDLAETLRRPASRLFDESFNLDLNSDNSDRDLAESPPFEIPDDLPDIQPAEREILSAERTLAEPRATHPARAVLPLIGAALLSLLAVGQLAWFNQDQVLATPAGYALVQGLCSLVGCTPPPRRAPSRFSVLERNIAPEPEQPGVLAMRVSFRNDADFPQPLPDIQLSLYDSEEKLLARRLLHPRESLFPAPADDTQVAPGSTVRVDLQLEDPGRRATGFKLEFL